MDRYMENQKEREKDNAFMRYTHISVDLVEKDHALTSMEIFPEGLNPFGMVHGGLLDTMLDNAAGSAVHTDGRSYVTQTCTLHFLRNRGEGKLIGEGWVIHRGRATALVKAELRDEAGAVIEEPRNPQMLLKLRLPRPVPPMTLVRHQVELSAR